MAEYEITPGVQSDLLDIGRYTTRTWGAAQALRYKASLTGAFAAIARDEIRSRAVKKSRPELRFARCEHHYIFFQVREGREPLILAVLHERMELMERLKERLSRSW